MEYLHQLADFFGTAQLETKFTPLANIYKYWVHACKSVILIHEMLNAPDKEEASARG
jgi:hypothetical protein